MSNLGTSEKSPALRGGLTALLAALLFGVSTPLTQHFGAGLGPFTTAALLYAGAAAVALLFQKTANEEARVRRSDTRTLLAMAAFGAVVGPVALAWGLQRTSGTSASLMLALEALFTVALARWMYGESIDRRVSAAMFLLIAGGLVLVFDQGQIGNAQLHGLSAVLLATLAWGVDNTLSRAVAERDPGQVVLFKALLGSTATTVLAWAFSESLPAMGAMVTLFLIGATGYGLSLRFYLLAQRAFGAGRTGSVFAFAPFIGAFVAYAAGERAGTWVLSLGGVLMLCGVVLHLAERHAHTHSHDPLEHEHAHRHDDGHHDHTHDPMPTGAHNHAHVHDAVRHAHPHVPDSHHVHSH